VRCTTATSSSHSAMTSSFGSALAITRHGRPCRACPGVTSRRSGRRHRGHLGDGSGFPRHLSLGLRGKAAWTVPEVAPR
jgi:hypothetical protein